MSTLSMIMLPDRASKNRNRASVNDDFPAPVRPTMPMAGVKIACALTEEAVARMTREVASLANIVD